uniref:Guanine nucleotide-binding protein alpha-1 subunit n=1 Tax=Lygus hesperus TaxID=30085 RepID=A0A0A9VUL7_LYGHE
MITLIKVLTLVLISFLAYDTVNFVLQVHRAELPTQVEVRPKYEATVPLPPVIHEDVTHDEDIFLGVGFFVFLTGVAGLVMMYFSKTKNLARKAGNGVLALRRVPEEPYLSYFYDVDRDYAKDDPRLMKNFSEIQLTLEPQPETPLGAKSSFEKMEDDFETTRLFQTTQNKTFELTTDEDVDEDEASDDIIDVNLLNSNTSLEVHNTTRRGTTLTQTESSMACECNMEQFEERLGAVEHGLKLSTEATKEWSKRIEQAEVDLVNLHRQMYTILSKAEFIAPSSDVFSKNAGSTTPTDFYDSTLYKVPDIIVETKKELEQGDLFRKSLTKLSSDDNWNTIMEDELAEKIKELTGKVDQPHEQSLSTTTTDPSKIKEALMKKNEELKEKTRGIVKAMEEAVKTSHMRKNKMGVHSHFVPPYKRIQHADLDNPAANNLRPKSNKFK